MADTQLIEREAASPRRAIRLVDCDVHTTITPAALHARLSSAGQRHLERFGLRVPSAIAVYPRMRGGGSRLDARPANGFAGSDLALLQEQLLDEYDVAYAILNPMQPQTLGMEAPTFAAELCRAFNDWTREEWLDRDPRLLGSICPPHEHADLAVAEIERLAGDERFVQVLMPTRMERAIGAGNYRPILRAATEAGLPVAMHTGGLESYRGSGWPSYYLEMHALISTTMAQQFLSLICSGVFEEIPALRIVAVETGIGWAAALGWALDDAWRAHGDAATTGLRRPPSEYLREHVWFTTQPIEEPDDPQHLAVVFDALGMRDRIMYSSDYPHWDFDAPGQTLPRSIGADDRARIFAGNACGLYDLPRQACGR
jgi:predicted TIM-barrel fold metal-dependent hydrolase